MPLFRPASANAAFSPRSCAAVGLVDAPAPRRVFDAFMLSAENLMLRLRPAAHGASKVHALLN